MVSPLSKITEVALNARFFDNAQFVGELTVWFSEGQVNDSRCNKLVTEILKAFENTEVVSAVCLYLSKAFDCVDHILLNTLAFYGMRG